MKPNTLIELPDGRRGRTVYHNLDGYGIKWGEDVHDEFNLPAPDAMLRDPYPSCEYEAVGKEFTVVDEKHEVCECGFTEVCCAECGARVE